MSDLVTVQPSDGQPVKELVVISGKGGTGKTSMVASFAALARGAVLAACDVDAADLHLVVDPRIVRREPFAGANGPGSCPINVRRVASANKSAVSRPFPSMVRETTWSRKPFASTHWLARAAAFVRSYAPCRPSSLAPS